MGRFYRVHKSAGLVVPHNVAGAGPGVSSDLTLRFPRAEFVTGVAVIPRPLAGFTMEAIAALLALTIVDEQTDAIVSDARASSVVGTAGGRLQVAAETLLLGGFGWRPFPLQRPVAALDQWTFAVQNQDLVSDKTLAGIFVYTEEPE